MIKDSCGVGRKVKIGRLFMLRQHGAYKSITNTGRFIALQSCFILGHAKTNKANKIA